MKRGDVDVIIYTHLINILQQIFDDDKLWAFDQTDLKDACTLLLLRNANVEKLLKNENDKNDLELQRLISEQFQTDLELHGWVIQTINQVKKLFFDCIKKFSSYF